MSDTEAAKQIRDQRAKDKLANPLKVLRVIDGKHSARFSLNSGSYVTAHPTGHYTCLHKKCIDARIATTNGKGDNVCEHIEFVRDYDRKQQAFDAKYPDTGDNPFDLDVDTPSEVAPATPPAQISSRTLDDFPLSEDDE